MTLSLVVQNPEDLLALNNMIGDCVFDVEAVRFNRAEHQVIIPLIRTNGTHVKPDTRSDANGYVERSVVIRQVHTMRLQESEFIQYYSILRLQYDGRAGKVVVETNVPLEFELAVHALEMCFSSVD